MAPYPVEIDRPQFVTFGNNDMGGINIPLDDPVVLVFNEKMDPSTFPGNFILQSVSGSIDGTFKLAENADSVVIFTPGTNMKESEIYTIYVHGGVRDANGNSILSPLEDDVPQTSWFFTSGQYALNGYPHIFAGDKNGNKLYLVSEINRFIDSLTIVPEQTFGAGEMRITPDGSKLIIANRLANGTISIFNPQNMSKITDITVGTGPENLFLTNDKAYVVNLSGRNISVVNLGTLSTETTFGFPDNFRPRDIVYSSKTNKLYISNDLRDEYDRLRVVDATNYSSYYDVTKVTPTMNKTIDMEISNDGETIFIAEFQTNNISIFSTGLDTIVATLQSSNLRNEDGVIAGDNYYLVTSGGYVCKIDIATLTVQDQLELEKTALGIAATVANELLYVVTPADSTLQIIETSTLTLISSVKIPAIMKNIVVSINNYN
jgi:hypothetical protein